MASYGNCSGFKVCNENEDFLKYNECDGTEEKDYRQMIMSTPPSNVNKGNKYNIMANSTQGGIALFTCTPKDLKDGENKATKEECVKPTSGFNQGMIIN